MALPFGLVIGSFLNVVIHRVPRGESVVTPRSHCPHCNRQITWYENVPLFSYLALGGRCRGCRAPISPRYFAVELITGLLFAVLAIVFGFGIAFFKYALFGSLMIALTMIDLNERLLPDVLTKPGMATGVAFSFFVPIYDGTGRLLARIAGAEYAPDWIVSPLDALVGGLAGAGLLWLVAIAYKALRHQEGMGLGDVKLMGLVGTFLGLKLALLTIFLGSLVGSIIGGSFMLLARKDSRYELPFGTFLGFTAIFSALWGKEIVQWYLSTL